MPWQRQREIIGGVRMAKRDYYEVLGLQKGADEAQIKSAFRKLAIKFHPDKNPGDKVAEEKIKEINEAYQVLSDSKKKAQYDQYGTTDFNAGGAGAGAGGGYASQDFGDFGDIFESFFGGGFGGGSRRRTGPTRGADLEYRLDLTFEEAVFGVDKDIQVTRTEDCDICSGSGAKPGSKPVTCKTCHGSGTMRVQRQTLFGNMVQEVPCQTCGGSGQTIDNPCNTCNGKGQTRQRRKINVKVPAGVDTGNVMPLRGQGDKGAKGGPAGDLHLVISVKPSKVFIRKANHIYVDSHINIAEAAIGKEVKVPTIDGEVSYEIPAGTQSGTLFRLKGKGVPEVNSRSGARGDQYVNVIVDVPKKLNDAQKEALYQFMEASGQVVDREEKKDKKGKWKFGLF